MHVIGSITKVQLGAGWLHPAHTLVSVVIQPVLLIGRVWTGVQQLFSSANKLNMI